MPKSAEEKLIEEGWQKMAIYDEPRLSEMTAMYAEIGLEVHLEPFNAADEQGCTGCMQMFPEQFKTIYVRKKSGPDGSVQVQKSNGNRTEKGLK